MEALMTIVAIAAVVAFGYFVYVRYQKSKARRIGAPGGGGMRNEVERISN